MTLTNSTLSSNLGHFGGGIFNNDTLTVTNSTLSGNSASVGGGGIDNVSTLTLSYSTLSSNSATDYGGGILSGIYNGGTLTMLSPIVAGNSRPTGPDVDSNSVSADDIMMGDSSGSSVSNGNGNILNPSSTGLATSLASNGGPTLTLALSAGSPALAEGGGLTTIAGSSSISAMPPRSQS